MSLDMKPFTVEGIEERELEHGSEEGADADVGGGGEVDAPEPERASFAQRRHTSRPDWYYRYELRGILAHTGTVDTGHYYSFIREHKTTEK